MKSRRIISALLAATLVTGCVAPVAQFFDDTYFTQDRIYRNSSLAFAVQYRGNWKLAIEPRQMSRTGKKAAKVLQQSGRELLYTGATFEGTQGTRAIVCNLNLSNEEYLKEIRSSNTGTIQEDYGAINFVTESTIFLKWQYRFAGLRFVEFLFRTGTYNVRIAFWTRPDLYERFLPEYEHIIESLVFTERL